MGLGAVSKINTMMVTNYADLVFISCMMAFSYVHLQLPLASFPSVILHGKTHMRDNSPSLLQKQTPNALLDKGTALLFRHQMCPGANNQSGCQILWFKDTSAHQRTTMFCQLGKDALYQLREPRSLPHHKDDRIPFHHHNSHSISCPLASHLSQLYN